MKNYYVDIKGLSNDEKNLAYEKLDTLSFMTTRYYGDGNKLIGLIVGWDRTENFSSYVKLLDLPFRVEFHEVDHPYCEQK